jgi:hypothetical protein
MKRRDSKSGNPRYAHKTEDALILSSSTMPCKVDRSSGKLTGRNAEADKSRYEHAPSKYFQTLKKSKVPHTDADRFQNGSRIKDNFIFKKISGPKENKVGSHCIPIFFPFLR